MGRKKKEMDCYDFFRERLDEEFEKRRDKNYKYSKTEFAKLLGIDNTLLSYYLSGKKSPSLENIYKIAISLNCSIDSLVGLPEKKRDITDDEIEINSISQYLGLSPNAIKLLHMIDYYIREGGKNKKNNLFNMLSDIIEARPFFLLLNSINNYFNFDDVKEEFNEYKFDKYGICFSTHDVKDKLWRLVRMYFDDIREESMEHLNMIENELKAIKKEEKQFRKDNEKKLSDIKENCSSLNAYEKDELIRELNNYSWKIRRLENDLQSHKESRKDRKISMEQWEDEYLTMKEERTELIDDGKK